VMLIDPEHLLERGDLRALESFEPVAQVPPLARAA